ncbi:ribosomal protein S5 domain 2-type protein [Entophlyctis helioformis]|nr:ribosomal protein S5 domain 2-type protein [Entophlyctis helioformis]
MADAAAADAAAVAAQGFVLDPDTFKKIQPLEYHRRFLDEGVRADGRPLLHFRETSLNVGSITTANGSVLLKQGNTTVVCGIKAELAQPLPTTPRRGFLVPNIDLPALCSPLFRPGPPGELTQSLSSTLNSLVTSGHILDLETLCVTPGRAVWVLYADILCLDYAGNVLDAAVAALMAALKNVVLPAVTVDDNDDAPPTLNGKVGRPLQLSRALISSTFGVFDGRLLLADPTHEEEALVSSCITVVLDDQGLICGVYKPGGSAVSKAMLDECIVQARARSKHLLRLLAESAPGALTASA